MLKRLSLVKRLFRDLPRQVKLTYCLLFDERVPLASRAALLGGMGLIVTPFVNLPAWIPVVGEMDVLALTLVATRLFIGSAPDDVVEEHEQLIRERRSRFDEDVARGERLALALAGLVRREPRPEMEFVGVAHEHSAATEDVSGVSA